MLPHDAPVVVPETDDGPESRGPERLCAVDRVAKPRDELIRFALSPDNVVTPDLKNRLPGRGVWVSAERGKIEDAVKRKVFARAFRKDVTVPADLPDLVGEQLKSSLLGAMGLSRRAGQMVLGFAKVESALRSGEAGLLIQASDARPDGIRKLAGLTGDTVETFRLFSADELSLALGRGNVIHASAKVGPQLKALMDRCRGYARYLGGSALETSTMSGPVRAGEQGK